MGTVAVIYCIGGFVFLIACVMDGQDVKPLWMRWLGTKLHNLGNRFDRRQYCHKKSCKAFPRMLKQAHQNIEFTHYNNMLIESKCVLPYYEIERAKYNERMAIEHGLNPRLLPDSSYVFMVEELKEKCIKDVLSQTRPFIDITVREDECNGNVYVMGKLNVGKKR